MTMDNKTILDLLKNGGLAAALIAILLYFGTGLMTKLNELQKDLVNIRIELTTIQNTQFNREDIQRMIDTKIRQLELKYHK